MILLRHGQSEFNLHYTATRIDPGIEDPRLTPLGHAQVLVTPAVRERYAFVCDVGSPVADLAVAWPGHDFSALDDIWWPQQAEPEARVVERANAFRAEMAADPQWQRTVVVSHWGFIMALTGISVQNGQWMRVDPNAPAPAQNGWRV